MDNSMRPITAEMETWLSEDVRAAHLHWRTYLDGLASYEREVLAAPEAWAPIILRDLKLRAERQRARLLDHYGVDPDAEDQGSLSNRPRNRTELEVFLRASLEYAMSRSALAVIETNVARLPREQHAKEVCECWLASNYTIPAWSMILVETLAAYLDSRSAQQAASETLAAYLAGFFACKISLNKKWELTRLLNLEDGSAFQNLLRHLPQEALGVWTDADPLRQRMDDLAKKAAKTVRGHLKAEYERAGNVEEPDDQGGFGELEEWKAREAARSEWDLYLDAKAGAGLSEQQSQVLALREAGYSYKEISDLLAIKTTGQAGKVLSDAYKKVRAEIDRLR
jgi:hypothetical protein